MTMVTVDYFNAQIDTKRFKKGQKVWIQNNCANHLCITFKWRNKFHYKEAIISKWNSSYNGLNKHIGKIKQMEVEKEFAERRNLNYC